MARVPWKPARFAISVAKATGARSSSPSHPPTGGVLTNHLHRQNGSEHYRPETVLRKPAKGGRQQRSLPSCGERVRLDVRINRTKDRGTTPAPWLCRSGKFPDQARNYHAIPRRSHGEPMPPSWICDRELPSGVRDHRMEFDAGRRMACGASAQRMS
jgi:hypothetical protein